jgi:chromosome segregation ATPase
MNAISFFLHRLGWQLGLRNERNRWSAVTRETQLLSEAQDLLGKSVWDKVEKVEDLTGEYWQLRDKNSQQTKLREESEQVMDKIEAMQDTLEGIEGRYDAEINTLQAKKDSIMDKAGSLNEELEDIRSNDAGLRQRFNSLKNKLEVLKKQEDASLSEEIEKTRQGLADLKLAHEDLKHHIETKEQEIRDLEVVVTEVERQIGKKRESMRQDSADLVAEIGRNSKLLAEISAKVGALENAKNELTFKMGQYLSNNLDSRDEEIRKILSSNEASPLISKIHYLRKSIQYNTRLARRAPR